MSTRVEGAGPPVITITAVAYLTAGKTFLMLTVTEEAVSLWKYNLSEREAGGRMVSRAGDGRLTAGDHTTALRGAAAILADRYPPGSAEHGLLEMFAEEEAATENWQAVGEAIRARSRELGISKKLLAELSGVSAATIRQMTNSPGSHQQNERTLQALSETLGWPRDFLLDILEGPETRRGPLTTPATPGRSVAGSPRPSPVMSAQPTRTKPRC